LLYRLSYRTNCRDSYFVGTLPRPSGDWATAPICRDSFLIDCQCFSTPDHR